MRVYIAAPIFNPHQIAVVESIKEMCENRIDAEVFSPYHASREIWAGRKPADCSQEERDLVVKGNVDNLHSCDVMVAWLNREDGGYDGRTDTGVLWEMGYFAALGRTRKQKLQPGTITIGYVHPYDPIPEKGLNLMLTGTMDALTMDLYQLERALFTVFLGGNNLSVQYPTNRDATLERD